MDNPIMPNEGPKEYLLNEEENYPTQEEINENKIELQVSQEIPPPPPPPPLPIFPVPITPSPTSPNPPLIPLVNAYLPPVKNEVAIDYVNNPNIVPSNQPEVVLYNPEKPFYEKENEENKIDVQNENENEKQNQEKAKDKRCCLTRCCCCICGCIGKCLCSCYDGCCELLHDPKFWIICIGGLLGGKAK